MSEVKSILLVGVGGQGAILTAKVLVNGLMRAGYDVKMSEVHGMSQRGGSVSTQVRWGEKVYSPLIGDGAADYMVAFEKMEAVRYASFLKPDGVGHHCGRSVRVSGRLPGGHAENLPGVFPEGGGSCHFPGKSQMYEPGPVRRVDPRAEAGAD